MTVSNNWMQKIATVMATGAIALAGFALGETYAANRERGEIAVQVQTNAANVEALRDNMNHLLERLSVTNERLATVSAQLAALLRRSGAGGQ